MTLKREIRQAKREMQTLKGQHEVLRFQIMWNKLTLLAAKASDAELLEDMSWHLKKLKHYTDKHSSENKQRDNARSSGLTAEQYKNHEGKARTRKELASLCGFKSLEGLRKWEERNL